MFPIRLAPLAWGQLNQSRDQLASNLFELCKRARLVRLHEQAVSGNIGGEDGSQATFHGGVTVPLAPK